ncbi:MAG: DUF1565 domain-containing protein [Candidatus Eisenbacteria bacterium]
MRAMVVVTAMAALAGAIVLSGCGSDSGGTGTNPKPVTGVSLNPDQMEIEVGHSREITPTVNGDNKNLTWYVNGITDGNEVVGEISENSPVTYTAPNWLPDPATVMVKAVSVEDTTIYDSCMVTVTFDKLFVDAVNGTDANNGCISLPFKTLTHAISVVDSGGTIVAQPGVYDEANGEDFPIECRTEGVTITGMDWEQCIIRGHGLGYQSVVNAAAQGSAIRKFTLEQGLPADETQITVYVWGPGVRLDSLRVIERARYEIVRGENAGGTDLVIENCYFVIDDGQTLDNGITLLDGSDGAAIRNCTFTGFNIGLQIIETCDVLVENCLIEGNEEGVLVRHEAAPNSLNPDFGGGARGSAGGNIIRDNTQCGLSIELDHPIFAKFNTWTNDPPVAGVDYCVTGTGGVIVE